MKWFVAFVLVIACSGLGYCATLGADSDSEQKCGDVSCNDKNSVDFKNIGVKATPKDGQYVCITLKLNMTDTIPTRAPPTDTPTKVPPTDTPTKVPPTALGDVFDNFDDQCALKYDGDKDLCDLIKGTSTKTEKAVVDCDVHDANGAYQFAASLPVAAILFVCLYLLQ